MGLDSWYLTLSYVAGSGSGSLARPLPLSAPVLSLPGFPFGPMFRSPADGSVTVLFCPLVGSTQPGGWNLQFSRFGFLPAISMCGQGHALVRWASDSHVRHLAGHLYSTQRVFF